jgi:hypothetical protein
MHRRNYLSAPSAWKLLSLLVQLTHHGARLPDQLS